MKAVAITSIIIVILILIGFCVRARIVENERITECCRLECGRVIQDLVGVRYRHKDYYSTAGDKIVTCYCLLDTGPPIVVRFNDSGSPTCVGGENEFDEAFNNRSASFYF